VHRQSERWRAIMTVMPAVPALYHPAALSTQAAALARSLSRRRGMRNLAGLDIYVVAPPVVTTDWVAFDLGVACGHGRATVPARLLHHVLNTLDPAAPSAAPDAAALLLELALEPALTALESRFPSLAVRLSPACSKTAATYSLGLSVRFGDVVDTLRLDLDVAAAGAVAAACAQMTDAPMASPDLPVGLHLRVQSTDVTVTELAAAQPGDVILADALPDNEVLVVCGERFAWRAQREGQRLQLLSSRLRPETIGLGRWMMGAMLETDEPTGLDELPVRLAFELGRLELPLSEIAVLGPGHVFELARDESQPVDILANGRLIGRGRIVTVAGRVGVQIVHLGRE
jgi:type III secretion protein Q